MSTIKQFFLPDLGEGLPDAEIVEWHVSVGDTIRLDEPLVSMETAKAVVEVPSPYSGKVIRLAGKPGDVIDTGSALADFEIDPNLPQRLEAQETGHHHGPPKKALAAGAASAAIAPQEATPVAAHAAPDIAAAAAPAPAPAPPSAAKSSDAGTVVGAVESSDRVVAEAATSVGGVKAMPAVRALAKKLGIDLARVRASGPDGVVTLTDVKQAAANGSATGPVAGAASTAIAPSQPAPVAAHAAPNSAALAAPTSDPRSAAGKPIRTTPPTVAAKGQPEPLRGVRRNMARIMAAAHAAVVPTTITDDADIHAWPAGEDIMARLVRSIVVAARAEPALNAWFDMENATRTLHQRVDIGIAVDTEEGLFVPALRNADTLDPKAIRAAITRLREGVESRSIAASELTGYTISLSNFGKFAGRYATPVIVPPCVAIVAAGKSRHQLVPVMGGIETHKIIPLSLTFDHRAATGGEAARFLKAMLDDLARAS